MPADPIAGSQDVVSKREHQLLLAAAHVRLDRRARERLLPLVDAEVDWARLCRLASRHGVAPLVFHTLTAVGGVDAADPRIAPFRARFLANAANSLVLARELVELMAVFERLGVAALAYKGPALAASLYGNLALREFSDLDVVIAPAAVSQVRLALVERGYQPALVLSPAQERALVTTRAGYYLRFDRQGPAGPIVLELHWRIPSTFRSGDLTRGRRTTVTLLNRQVPHFAPEDLLLLLCDHGVKHAWNQLKWICDVAELIQQEPQLDWEVAVERATRVGGRRVLLLGCAVAQTTLDVELPTRVAHLVAADRVVPELAARLCRQLLDRPMLRIGVVNNIRLRERTTDKLRYGARMVGHLTSPSVSDRALWPSWPGAPLLYGLLHPFRLAGRLVRKQRRWNKG